MSTTLEPVVCCAPLDAPGAGKVTTPLWFVTVTVRFTLLQLGSAVEVSMA